VDRQRRNPASLGVMSADLNADGTVPVDSELLFVSEQTMCCRQQRFVTWASSSTVTSQCSLTSQGLYPGVLRFCGSCAASDVLCPTPCSRRWSLRWLCHASTRQRDTSGTPCVPAASTPVSSQCCSQADIQVTSLGAHYTSTPRQTSTGCGLRSASISS